MQSSRAILDALRGKGHRITLARSAVVELFVKIHKPLSAAQVQTLLKKKAVSPNATTVYRELQFLEKEGILSTVHFKDGVARYELSSLPHHHHLVCVSCDAVEDVHMEHDLHAVEKNIAKSTGFAVQEHALEFYGTCRRCR